MSFIWMAKHYPVVIAPKNTDAWAPEAIVATAGIIPPRRIERYLYTVADLEDAAAAAPEHVRR